VHAYYSGVFHLTLHVPRAWVPAELVTWNDAGRAADRQDRHRRVGRDHDRGRRVFEVMEFRPFSANAQEGILTVRSLRGQF
jgi:hypothetical protein